MVKFLSTSSNQTNLQNLSSPLHLSVLQHFSVILSYRFTALSATPLFHVQPLNGIISIILSINIVEVIDREYQRILVEQNSFSCRTVTVTETVTVNSYDRHRSSGCCPLITA